MPLPEVEGVLTSAEVAKTAESIAEWQLPTGMIPWYPGGHVDRDAGLERTALLVASDVE